MRQADLDSEPIEGCGELFRLLFNCGRIKAPTGKTSRLATW
jgi:hypothetical protein